jgi:hypothetical protein
MIPKLEVLSKLKGLDLAFALDTWTCNSIGDSNRRLKQKQVEAVELLSNVRGQSFPRLGYRAIFIDPNHLKSFKDFRSFIIDRGLPESYSSDVGGMRSFFNDGGGSASTLKTRGLFLEVEVPRSDWLFNVSDLIGKLSPQEIKLVEHESGNMSLSVYLKHKEVVAKSGTMLRALKSNSVKLVGYEENRKFKAVKPATLTASVLANLVRDT